MLNQIRKLVSCRGGSFHWEEEEEGMQRGSCEDVFTVLNSTKQKVWRGNTKESFYISLSKMKSQFCVVAIPVLTLRRKDREDKTAAFHGAEWYIQMNHKRHGQGPSSRPQRCLLS